MNLGVFSSLASGNGFPEKLLNRGFGVDRLMSFQDGASLLVIRDNNLPLRSEHFIPAGTQQDWVFPPGFFGWHTTTSTTDLRESSLTLFYVFLYLWMPFGSQRFRNRRVIISDKNCLHVWKMWCDYIWFIVWFIHGLFLLQYVFLFPHRCTCCSTNFLSSTTKSRLRGAFWTLALTRDGHRRQVFKRS